MPFNDDTLLADKFLAIRDKYGIENVIETGTYHADTTQWLAKHFKNVYTCEVSEAYFKIGQEKLMPYTNVVHKLLDSRTFLKYVLPTLKGPTLIFLDAHWYENPLLGEILTIAESGVKPILAIHDFQVPGKDFGYDTYPGIVYNWDYIKDAVAKVYGSNFTKEYNEEATGSRRGCIFLYPTS